MAKACAVSEFLKTSVGGGATDAGGNGGDKAVFLEREIGDKVVQLKDKPYFVTQQMQPAAMAIQFHIVD
jgi:hypothetical protein